MKLMESKRKVAIVTGGNKGIGFAIVRGLCKKFDGDVYLTARNKALGMAAVAELAAEGLTAKFYCLDIKNVENVENLKEELMNTYDGLDLLINNAAIAYGVSFVLHS